ncbi:MAG: hypothetical protein JWQ36_1563 [Enterovirga sp.]|jgi:hypothetical protein|nr:hypothetical protein [Enterovirga sp.]
MATGFSIIVDTPPYGVSSTLPASAASTAESAVQQLREGRTVYVSTPDGEIIPGDEFVAEVAQGAYS